MSGNEEAVVTEENDRERRRRQRIAKLRETFTPASPVQTREIFSGRQKQLLDCLHVRGGGKADCRNKDRMHVKRLVSRHCRANILKNPCGKDCFATSRLYEGKSTTNDFVRSHERDSKRFEL